MICDEVKPKLHEYFEDQLPEKDRGLIRSHLKDCCGCRDYSFAFSSFATDLRRFAGLEPPAELKDKVLQEFEKPQASFVQEPVQRSSALWAWVFVPMILIPIGIGVWGTSRQSAKHPPALGVAPEEEVFSPTARLEEQPRTSSSLPDPLHSSKYDITIRPFHWDLGFPSLEKRNTFLARLREHDGPLVFHFESPSFMVFSIPRDGLKEVLNLLIQAGAGGKGGRSIPSYIPDYSGSARVSMAFEIPQSRISRTLSHHWHLKFGLPNKFTFKEQLRDAGGRFLYETAEIWVVEISGTDFEQLQAIIRDTHGLTTDISPDLFVSTQSYEKIPIRITLYLEED